VRWSSYRSQLPGLGRRARAHWTEGLCRGGRGLTGRLAQFLSLLGLQRTRFCADFGVTGTCFVPKHIAMFLYPFAGVCRSITQAAMGSGSFAASRLFSRNMSLPIPVMAVIAPRSLVTPKPMWLSSGVFDLSQSQLRPTDRHHLTRRRSQGFCSSVSNAEQSRHVRAVSIPQGAATRRAPAG